MTDGFPIYVLVGVDLLDFCGRLGQGERLLVGTGGHPLGLLMSEKPLPAPAFPRVESQDSEVCFSSPADLKAKRDAPSYLPLTGSSSSSSGLPLFPSGFPASHWP